MDKAYAYRTALTMLHWDNSTSAPKEAVAFTAKAIGILSAEHSDTIINDDVKQLLEKLSNEEEQEKLSAYEKAIVKQMRKDYRNCTMYC